MTANRAKDGSKVELTYLKYGTSAVIEIAQINRLFENLSLRKIRNGGDHEERKATAMGEAW